MNPGPTVEKLIGRDAPVRLVCLPFAGGGSGPFYRWRRHMPACVELAPVSLPGHDGRLTEPPLKDLRVLVELLVDKLLPMFDKPSVLLGHSMGAWLAFEMARELRRRGARLPELLVVAANRAPHERSAESPIHRLPDEELLDELGRRFGGIPPEVSASRELLQLLMPALRADIQMIETYRYIDEPPLETEILALAGIDDPAVSAAQLNAWRNHTSRAFSARWVPGGHFFLFDAKGADASTALRVVVDRIKMFGASADSPTTKS